MKRLIVFLSLLMVPLVSPAIIITLFTDIDTYIKRGLEIVIAESDSIDPETQRNMRWGLSFVTVRVVQVLKGARETGDLTIGTIYPMIPGKTYLLYTIGGGVANKTEFVAIPELSVVEVPASFDLKRLDGKSLRDQVALLFSERLAQVRKELAEKTVLTFSLRDSDRQALWVRLQARAPNDHVSTYLSSQFSPETRKLLASHDPSSRSGNAELTLSHSILKDLNRIIRSGSIYDVDCFSGIKLSAQTLTLLKQNPRGEDLVRLNIGLLLDAYPLGLWRDRELDQERPLLEKAVQSAASPPRDL
jgi:hypothetical protein